MLYPFVANWFSRCDKELDIIKAADFLKLIILGGWVLDPATAQLISDKFPSTQLENVFK
jgi:hypothetical protein